MGRPNFVIRALASRMVPCSNSLPPLIHDLRRVGKHRRDLTAGVGVVPAGGDQDLSSDESRVEDQAQVLLSFLVRVEFRGLFFASI